MAIRSRLRRAFTRGSQESEGGPLSKITSKSSKASKREKVDSNVYQPGEKMPPMKYRRPVDPVHKANLESFSWAKAWRRKSDPSIYSPMGSRMPSRKNSIVSFGRRSLRRKSSSVGSDIGVDSGIGGSIVGDDRPEQLREASDEEGDVTNVGLSHPPTNDRRRSSSLHARRSQSIKSGSSRPATASDRVRRSLSTSKGDKPFTAEDLELALQRSHLDPTKEESDRSGEGSPGSPNGGQKAREEAPASTGQVTQTS